MTTRTTISVILAVYLGFYLSPATAADAEEQARMAEQSGKVREALNGYLTALQSAAPGSAKERELRERLISVALTVRPPPAIPEDARRFAVRGRTAIGIAQTEQGFLEGAREFDKAIRLAPWWADAYFNYAVALEGAGRYAEAMDNLKLYLLAAPGAKDAEQVRERIYALEFKQEKAQSAAATKQQERSRLKQLAGSWLWSTYNVNGWEYADICEISVREETYAGTCSSIRTSPQGQVYRQAHYFSAFSGTMKGTDLEGEMTVDWRPRLANGVTERVPLKGSLSADGKQLRLDFDGPAMAGGATGNVADGWTTKRYELTLIRQ